MQVASQISRLEAEMHTPFGEVQLLRRNWIEPIDISGVGSNHHLELSLLPRTPDARGCFPDRWGASRFEPIGEMFLMPAGETVRAKSGRCQQSSIVCNLRPDAVATWLDNDLEWTVGRLQVCLNIGNPVIRNLLFRLGEEIRHPGFATEALAELMIGQIAIELTRQLMGVEDNRAAGGLVPWRLRLIEDRLAEPAGAVSLVELANLCRLSVRQLTRGFRASRGCSIGSYIADSRIEHAKRLLAADECVKSVAYAMGFSSPSNFSVTFRRATGATPSEYRHRNGRNAGMVMPSGSTRH